MAEDSATSLSSDTGDRVRPFEPPDALRCAVAARRGMSGNLALTLAELRGAEPFAAAMLALAARGFSPRSRELAWTWTRAHRIRAVCSARPRFGPKSWEIERLYADSVDEWAIVETLERVSAACAARGAERVFLRTDADGDVPHIARAAGFFSRLRETLYASGEIPKDAATGGLLTAGARLRKRLPSDDYALFRLYSAAAPVSVRQLAGMTLDQWTASRERAAGRADERVLEMTDGGGALAGYVATRRWFGTGVIEMLIHPDYAALTDEMADAALRSLAGVRRAIALAPEHAPRVGDALERRGFAPKAELATLIKSAARPVGQLAAAPARFPGG